MKTYLALMIAVVMLGLPLLVIVAVGVAIFTVNLNLALIAAMGLACYIVMLFTATKFLEAVRQDIEKPTGSVVKLKKR